MRSPLNPSQGIALPAGLDPDVLKELGLLQGSSDPDRIAGTREEWLRALRFEQQQIPLTTQRRAEKLRSSIDILTFTEFGVAEAECVVGSAVFDVEFDVNFEEKFCSSGCTCSEHRKKECCIHTSLLVGHLIAQLRDLKSELSRSLEIEEESPTQLVLEELDRFLNRAEPSESVGLPKEQQVDEQRLVWRVTIGEQTTLSPILQTPKKRGVGWTKGKQTTVNHLESEPHLIASPVDQAVFRCFSQEHYYYRAQYDLDLVSAMEALEGHDLVFLEDQLLHVKSRPFGLTVRETNESFSIGIDINDLGANQNLPVTCTATGIVIVDPSQSRAIVMRFTQPIQQLQLARFVLQKEPCIPIGDVEHLRSRMDSLRRFVPVRLPASLDGDSVGITGQQIILLRARTNGQLDVALRIHDTEGRMAEPGNGLLRYPGKQDGQPVQFQRDAEAEIAEARKTATRLKLHREGGAQNWLWRIKEFEDILTFLESAESAAAGGLLEIKWDESSVSKLGVVGSLSPQNVRVEIKKDRDWFGLKGEFRVGENDFQLYEVLNALQNKRSGDYIEIKPGKWASITDEFRNRLLQLQEVTHVNRNRLSIDITAVEVLQDFDDGQIDFQAARSWKDSLKRLERARDLTPDPSKDFEGTLRDYQLDGYRWLRRLAEWGVGGCLADDMGLGKTIQVLAVLIDRAKKGPTLVIAPTSVGFNWQQESERFAPTLNATLYRETTRQEFLSEVGPGDVVICSYGLALRDEEYLRKIRWGTLVIDEAQFIKNSRSKTALAIRDLAADWKIAMTGTPMENHLGELWSLFRAVSPGLFGSWDRFRDHYAGPIEKQNDPERRKALSTLIQPFILRRTKGEVLAELPARTEINLHVDLSNEERSRYDEVRLAAIGELDEIQGLEQPQDQRFRILALLTRLRQLACHRRLVDSSWTKSSAKLDLLMEKLAELKEERHRSLIFSQFTQHLGLIRTACDEAGISYQYLDGKTTAKARKQRVEAFQAGEGNVFLISLKAGGTGLNLTGADYVIHMDPWWNPAVEDQATDRAHRMGQTKPVIVYRIIARGTIEEQILNLHVDKRDLVSGILDGTQAAGKLSTDDLAALIRVGAGT